MLKPGKKNNQNWTPIDPSAFFHTLKNYGEANPSETAKS